MFHFFPLQLPMNLSCHRDSIVLSLKLPYSQGSTPDGLVKSHNNTDKEHFLLYAIIRSDYLKNRLYYRSEQK